MGSRRGCGRSHSAARRSTEKVGLARFRAGSPSPGSISLAKSGCVGVARQCPRPCHRTWRLRPVPAHLFWPRRLGLSGQLRIGRAMIWNMLSLPSQTQKIRFSHQAARALDTDRFHFVRRVPNSRCARLDVSECRRLTSQPQYDPASSQEPALGHDHRSSPAIALTKGLICRHSAVPPRRPVRRLSAAPLAAEATNPPGPTP